MRVWVTCGCERGSRCGAAVVQPSQTPGSDELDLGHPLLQGAGTSDVMNFLAMALEQHTSQIADVLALVAQLGDDAVQVIICQIIPLLLVGVDKIRIVVSLAFDRGARRSIGAQKLTQLNVKGALADLALAQTLQRQSKLVLQTGDTVVEFEDLCHQVTGGPAERAKDGAQACCTSAESATTVRAVTRNLGVLWSGCSVRCEVFFLAARARLFEVSAISDWTVVRCWHVGPWCTC